MFENIKLVLVSVLEIQKTFLQRFILFFRLNKNTVKC
jgi:hypothetical protein